MHILSVPLLLAVLATSLAPARTAARHPDPDPDPLARATQLVVVTTPGWDATTGELRRFVREDTASPWRARGDVVPVVVGRSGLAWGVGYEAAAVAGADAPDAPDAPALEASSLAGPHKREGDGRSPAGVFPLEDVFGFATADSMAALEVPYLPLGPTLDCVDDTASVHYNRLVDRARVPEVDWRSAERMRRIGVYRLGVVVGYNPAAVRGRGSCIFLHVWEGPASTTAGCTAMDGGALERVVAWLDGEARPVLVQLPAPVYARAREEWRLPVLDR